MGLDGDHRKLPAPTWVEIQPDGGAFFLLRLDALFQCLADTWHPTLDQAKARFEFEIEDADWQAVDD